VKEGVSGTIDQLAEASEILRAHATSLRRDEATSRVEHCLSVRRDASRALFIEGYVDRTVVDRPSQVWWVEAELASAGNWVLRGSLKEVGPSGETLLMEEVRPGLSDSDVLSGLIQLTTKVVATAF
jgi:hypothetical protein